MKYLSDYAARLKANREAVEKLTGRVMTTDEWSWLRGAVEHQIQTEQQRGITR